MSKITDLYDYFLEFPECKNLLPITTEVERGKEIFFPRGSSSVYAVTNEKYDVLGNYNSVFEPYYSVYDDWQMNLYRYADANDDTQNETNINISYYQDVENICNRLLSNNQQRILPDYNGLKVFAIIPTGTMPVVWGADTNNQQITYAITIRVYYVNPNKRIDVEFNEYQN